MLYNPLKRLSRFARKTNTVLTRSLSTALFVSGLDLGPECQEIAHASDAEVREAIESFEESEDRRA
jgi:hypothetical protein